MKVFLILLISLFSYLAGAQQIRVGVFRDYNITRITFSYNNGSYAIYGDTTHFGSILPDEFVEVSKVGNKVRLKVGVIDRGLFDKVLLIQNKSNSSISLYPKSPVVKQRKYEDDFEISSGIKGLTVVNIADFNNYLSGVVESEGGGGKDIEYYKVQALMSRTYAMKYKSRHKKEGFSICDRVHCQAYHSMMRFTPLIDSAVAQTENIVMHDDRGRFIDSYFHANCGGQTCEPDYVWNNAIPYLETFVDTFCIYTRQAKWEKKVSQREWKNYLVKEYNYPVQDSAMLAMIYTFDQTERKAFYIHPSLGIPLRDLRTKFNLKSTFFSCHPEGDQVVIEGRGFGHGVGLCQEGAMKMAKYGYTYDQIARFYFPGIQIIHLGSTEFFNQIGEEELE